MIPAGTGPTVRSLDGVAGLLGVRGVRQQHVDAASAPPRRSPCRSVGRPSIGVGSSLKSPVCRSVPNGVSMATATPSGIECVTRRNRIENGPAVGVLARLDLTELGPVA